MDLRIIILVLAAEKESYLEDLRVHESTLGTMKFPNVDLFWVLGGAENLELRGNRLYLPIEEKFSNILMKTVSAIRILDEKFNPDIIIRTNTSSYFDLPRVYKLCKKLISSDFDFGGFLETYKVNSVPYSGVRFVNGSGMYLARNAIDLIKELDFEQFLEVPDDVAISVYLERLGVKTTQIRRNNICYHHIYFPRAHSRVKSFNNPSLTHHRMRSIHSFTISKGFFRKTRQLLKIFASEMKYSKISTKKTLRYLENLVSGGFKP